MKRFLALPFLFLFILIFTTSCYGSPQLNTQGAISLVQNDMVNVSTTLRSLDNLYLEDYAINEISPQVSYGAYNDMSYTNDFSENITARVSAPALNSRYSLNYSYTPKYIDNVNSLDSTYLLAYLQSMQDLFLITSDITAANQILSELTYSIINDTINVRNNAYMLNYNLNELSESEIAILQEYSVTINNALNNINITNGSINNELTSLADLRTNC